MYFNSVLAILRPSPMPVPLLVELEVRLFERLSF